MRVSEQIVQSYYSSYALRRKDKSRPLVPYLPSRKPSNEELAYLKKMLPRTGRVLISSCAESIDLVHNLNFGLNYSQLVHFDHSFNRLKALKKETQKGELMVLGDYSNLPFQDIKIDAFFSFNDMTHYEKDEQKLVYKELKRVLNEEGVSIMLYDKDKKLHAEFSVKTDRMMTKAKNILKLWKKEKISFVYFHGVEVSNNQKNLNDAYMPETSLGRQLS